MKLSVTNCTNGIMPIQARSKTIVAKAMSNFTFDVYSENTKTSAHVCKGKENTFVQFKGVHFVFEQ